MLSNASPDNFSRLTEVEAWTGPSPAPRYNLALGATATASSSWSSGWGPSAVTNGDRKSLNAGNGGSIGPQVHWLVTDHLGTPRMVFDQTGDLNKVTRHDYLPFGEELFAPTGGRDPGQGYAGGDGVRQQFTSKERDVETGLDFFINRYSSSVQGRFTSVDPGNAGADPSHPQSWNGYAYAHNNPLLYVDPDGLDVEVFWNGSDRGKWYGDAEFERFKRDLQEQGFTVKNGNIYAPVMDDDGNVVGQRRIGTYVSDMNSFGEGVIHALQDDRTWERAAVASLWNYTFGRLLRSIFRGKPASSTTPSTTPGLPKSAMLCIKRCQNWALKNFTQGQALTFKKARTF